MTNVKSKKIFLLVATIVVMLAVLQLSGGTSLKYVLASVFYVNSGGVNDKNIIFSKPSGFYDKAFQLSLYAPTEEIYYTLDGTDPDKNSLRYDGPIKISDASENQNIYSTRIDVTAAFLQDEIIKYCEEEKIIDYHVPDEKIDKCNTIKVVYYDREGNRSAVEEHVYFVGFQEKEGYKEVNMISVTTDPDNLFDSESGIYVLGKSFEEGIASGMFEDEFTSAYWWFWNANYRNKGRDWERKIHIEIFNEDKQLVLSQNAGMRIQGGGSRGFLPKSLNLYAREEYGDNRFRYDFWNTGYYPKRMTLFSGGDDYYTKIKDRLVSELVEDTEISTMNYEPYILFLNGEYWGIYYLTEKYDSNYMEHYYGVSEGNLIEDTIIIKSGEVESGVPADKYVSYQEMQDFIINNDMSNDLNYKKACEVIDVKSFIDYFAVEGYISRAGDWPSGNFALWRFRNPSKKKYEDGKWRRILYDVNSSAMEATSYDAIAGMCEKSPLFDSLCANEEFRRSFAKRWLEIADTCFDKEVVNQKLDEYVELMDEPMEKHFQRFFGTSNEKFYEEIENLRYFFNERRQYVVESIRVNFGEDYL